jgi:hypothetical protein
VLEARRISPDTMAVSVRLRNGGSQTPRLDPQGQIDPSPTLDFQDILTYWAGEFFWLVARDQARTTYFVLTDTVRACVCSVVPFANSPDQLRPR